MCLRGRAERVWSMKPTDFLKWIRICTCSGYRAVKSLIAALDKLLATFLQWRMGVCFLLTCLFGGYFFFSLSSFHPGSLTRLFFLSTLETTSTNALSGDCHQPISSLAAFCAKLLSLTCNSQGRVNWLMECP